MQDALRHSKELISADSKDLTPTDEESKLELAVKEKANAELKEKNDELTKQVQELEQTVKKWEDGDFIQKRY